MTNVMLVGGRGTHNDRFVVKLETEFDLKVTQRWEANSRKSCPTVGKVEAVLAMTDHMSHRQYYSIKKVCSRAEVPLVHISKKMVATRAALLEVGMVEAKTNVVAKKGRGGYFPARAWTDEEFIIVQGMRLAGEPWRVVGERFKVSSSNARHALLRAQSKNPDLANHENARRAYAEISEMRTEESGHESTPVTVDVEDDVSIKRRRRAVWPDEDILLIQGMRQVGRTWSECGKEFHVSASGARAAHRRGVTSKPELDDQQRAADAFKLRFSPARAPDAVKTTSPLSDAEEWRKMAEEMEEENNTLKNKLKELQEEIDLRMSQQTLKQVNRPVNRVDFNESNRTRIFDRDSR